jgi:beta-glucosidase
MHSTARPWRSLLALVFSAFVSSVAFGPFGLGAQEAPARYRDASRPVPERVADLLSRMTVDEKVAQLLGIWQQKSQFQDADGVFDPSKAKAFLGQGIGQVSRPSEIAGTPNGPRGRTPRQQAEYTNAVQKWLIENTRLGIPALFHEEALHGLAAPNATHFPVPLGLASTWDPALLERVMSVAAKEARARGCQHVLSPVVDLGRDPRWGRVEETYGEDPYLVSRLGVAAIRGYQGTTLPLGPEKVFATLKHYAGHGSHEGGINTAPTLIPERLLRAELLVPFEVAVKEAKPFTLMPSYNEVDGVPSHVNRWLIEDVLRREWGFDGLVVSDYYAIAQLIDRHRVAENKTQAAKLTIESGIDLELPDPDAFRNLPALIKDGQVPMATIDRAVSRMLTAKFLAGVFEKPYVDVEGAERIANLPEHRALALEAARRSIVLLKNDKNVLPLDRTKLKTLAVIGPNAKGAHLGGYSREPSHTIGVLEGITEKAGNALKVVYAEGVRITEEEPNWNRDRVVMGDPANNRRRIKEAVAVARDADAIVLVVGTNESTSREAWGDNHLGDAADISLSSQQDELTDAMLQLGKPVVVVLINGRPLAMPEVAERVPAILEAWYVGQEGGTAVAETLFGDVNPGGKLPISFPRHVGQIPVYYNRRPTSYRGFVDMTREPLWAFGHGLSYTTVTFTNVAVSAQTIGPADRVTVTADVANTGTRAGDEVVQLYLRDVVSSVTRPVKELRGFERVSLKPGEKRTVTFTLGPDALALIDQKMQKVVEPGRFDVMVGTNSTQLTTVSFQVVAK